MRHLDVKNSQEMRAGDVVPCLSQNIQKPILDTTSVEYNQCSLSKGRQTICLPFCQAAHLSGCCNVRGEPPLLKES